MKPLLHMRSSVKSALSHFHWYLRSVRSEPRRRIQASLLPLRRGHNWSAETPVNVNVGDPQAVWCMK